MSPGGYRSGMMISQIKAGDVVTILDGAKQFDVTRTEATGLDVEPMARIWPHEPNGDEWERGQWISSGLLRRVEPVAELAETPRPAPRERLTSWQAKLLVELRVRSARTGDPRVDDGWVRIGDFGAAGTCRKLIDKGFAEYRETVVWAGGKIGGNAVVAKWIRPLPSKKVAR